jgi:c-di-AMP phosphodiesterase-like protein
MKNSKYKNYMIMPVVGIGIIILGDILAAVTVKNDTVSFLLFASTAIYMAFLISLAVIVYGRMKKDFVTVGLGFHEVAEGLLKDFDVPYAIMDSNGEILWTNYAMSDLLDHMSKQVTSMTDLLSNITSMKLPTETDNVVFRSEINNLNYKVVMSLISSPEFDESLEVIQSVDGDNESKLIGVYLYDETEINVLRKENFDQQMIIGLLYIDNYDEVLETIDEVKRSLLVALIDRKINKYMTGINAVIKKLEKDKYLFVFQKKYLEEIKKSSKVLLEEVKKIQAGKNEITVTISMGLGIADSDYTKSYEYARAAIDLALGRGGDQVVIKNGDDISYIGGKSASIEKSTRVTARVKAHALGELIEAHDEIFIMGHSIGDVDSLGSAIGVYKITQIFGKKAYIVLNEVNSSISPIFSRFLDNPDYPSDMFIGNLPAQERAGRDSLLIVVDVNRPSHTECPELFDLIPTVIVLDHHRVTGDSVSHAVLSYIEPYASSASEMVAEILQYIGDGVKIKSLEAEALYAGIMIDTNNFLTKTGVRTFEAAAYLRKNGADVTRIRKAFRADMKEYVTKAEAITSTEIFMEGYAFAKCSSEGIEAPTILGAQVANELLEIVGVKASFVFTEYKGKIFISARSIDELNVQVVMEKLGGGGHMNIAGAQMEDVTAEEAIIRVKNVLSQMQLGGEL